MLCLQTLHAKPREENDPEKCRKGPQACKTVVTGYIGNDCRTKTGILLMTLFGVLATSLIVCGSIQIVERPSACPVDQQQRRAAGLLLSRQEISIDSRRCSSAATEGSVVF